MKHTEDIERLVERSYLNNLHVPADAGMDERILGDAVTKMEESRKTRSASAGPNIWRIIMKSRMTKLTTAAVAALVIIIGIIDFGEPVGGASAVFAAAMDSVRQARTFSCTEAFDVTYEDGGKRGEYLLKQKLMFKEPDRERREQLTSAPPWSEDVGKVTIWHYGKRQRLEFRPFDKTAEFHDTSSDYVIDEKTGELKLTQLNTRLRDHLLELSAGAVEDLGRTELNGQSVRMLQSRKGKRITTVWVNPETSYPVQIEHKWTDRSRSPMTFKSIQIDTELDDDLFSLQPPDAYTLSVHEWGGPDYKKKMMTKIKYLGLWCVVYANDNDDQFPDDLGDIVKLGVITEDVLNKVLAAPDDPDGPPVIRNRKPNTGGKDWSTVVILYEIYDQWPEDGVVACFADGHCELIANQKRFEELMK
jgi:outer membrane lipoprotein-sorting protein